MLSYAQYMSAIFMKRSSSRVYKRSARTAFGGEDVFSKSRNCVEVAQVGHRCTASLHAFPTARLILFTSFVLEVKHSLTDEQVEQRLVNIGDWEFRHVRQGEQPLVNLDVQGCLRTPQEISLQANVVPLPQPVGAGTEGLPSTGVVAIDNPVAELKYLKEQAAKLRQ